MNKKKDTPNISIQCVCIYLCMYIYICIITIIVYIYIYIYTVFMIYIYIHIPHRISRETKSDPNSVGYKNYSQAWGYRMGLLNPKWPLATKCQVIFNNLEKRTSLNTVIFCPYVMPGCFEKPFTEGHTFLTKCLCCFSKPRFGPCSFATKYPFDFDRPL